MSESLPEQIKKEGTEGDFDLEFEQREDTDQSGAFGWENGKIIRIPLREATKPSQEMSSEQITEASPETKPAPLETEVRDHTDPSVEAAEELKESQATPESGEIKNPYDPAYQAAEDLRRQQAEELGRAFADEAEQERKQATQKEVQTGVAPSESESKLPEFPYLDRLLLTNNKEAFLMICDEMMKKGESIGVEGAILSGAELKQIVEDADFRAHPGRKLAESMKILSKIPDGALREHIERTIFAAPGLMDAYKQVQEAYKQ